MFCPRCATPNKDDSKYCMKCGQSLEPGAVIEPLKQVPTKRKAQRYWYLWIVIPVGLLFMAVIVGIAGSMDKTSSNDIPAAAEVSSDASHLIVDEPSEVPGEELNEQQSDIESESSPSYVYELTADQLIADYDANEISADEKYKGKYVKVTGIVESIGKDILDDAYITMGESDKTFSWVQAYFKDNVEISKAGKLSEGDKVVVIGRVTGGTLNVLMSDCVIADK